jgi:ribosomal protein S18 acetylase RimI-like enzyme
MDFRDAADNLRQTFRVVASSHAAGEVRELPGVSIASSGVAFQMYNAAFLSEPVDSDTALARRLALAATHFRARGLQWSFWVCEDWLEPQALRGWRRCFERFGMRHIVDLPGMAAERLLPPSRELPRLDVQRVQHASTRRIFADISSSCFNVPLPWFEEVFSVPGVWDDFEAYIGYSEGVPLCVAATVAGEEVVGVYNVATLPSARRRGFGEAVMRHAVEDSYTRRGLRKTVLQSTPAGLRLYERMGYRTIARISVWTSVAGMREAGAGSIFM